ncbi:hypothetical protein EYF80_065022 [Liparis tanakae]|uniref:Uncharacterized protein n=1 Tax=Liparis tanakae TaxID=230148 RepID=A0A4Z2E953_9TELE|nr:hypothetical protein EYF80_065022 [Liparis tanakae]
MDHPPLQPLQGGVGLGHPAAGHLHRHLHAVLGRLPPQRGGGGAEEDLRLHLQPAQRGGPGGGRDVHRGHPHQLQDHLRQPQRRGGQPPGAHRAALLQGLVPHRHRGGHPLRSAHLPHRV